MTRLEIAKSYADNVQSVMKGLYDDTKKGLDIIKKDIIEYLEIVNAIKDCSFYFGLDTCRIDSDKLYIGIDNDNFSKQSFGVRSVKLKDSGADSMVSCFALCLPHNFMILQNGMIVYEDTSNKSSFRVIPEFNSDICSYSDMYDIRAALVEFEDFLPVFYKEFDRVSKIIGYRFELAKYGDYGDDFIYAEQAVSDVKNSTDDGSKYDLRSLSDYIPSDNSKNRSGDVMKYDLKSVSDYITDVDEVNDKSMSDKVQRNEFEIKTEPVSESHQILNNGAYESDVEHDVIKDEAAEQPDEEIPIDNVMINENDNDESDFAENDESSDDDEDDGDLPLNDDYDSGMSDEADTNDNEDDGDLPLNDDYDSGMSDEADTNDNNIVDNSSDNNDDFTGEVSDNVSDNADQQSDENSVPMKNGHTFTPVRRKSLSEMQNSDQTFNEGQNVRVSNDDDATDELLRQIHANDDYQKILNKNSQSFKNSEDNVDSLLDAQFGDNVMPGSTNQSKAEQNVSSTGSYRKSRQMTGVSILPSSKGPTLVFSSAYMPHIWDDGSNVLDIKFPIRYDDGRQSVVQFSVDRNVIERRNESNEDVLISLPIGQVYPTAIGRTYHNMESIRLAEFLASHVIKN